MKWSSAAASLLLGYASVAVAATPAATLTTLHEVHALSKLQAAQAVPVVFHATVTYKRQGVATSFVQEGNEGIQLQIDPNLKLSPGDRVLIKGKTKGGFRPIVIADNVLVVGRGSLPKPVRASFDELNHSAFDSERVTIHAVVRHKDVKSVFGRTVTLIHMQADGGTIDAWIDGSDPHPDQGMFDDEIQVTGISTGKVDAKQHQIGVKLTVASFEDVKVLKHSAVNPWTLPATPIDRLLDAYHVTDQSARIRVQGTLTFYQPGAALVIQNGDDSLWVTTSTEKPLRIGTRVDVTGFGLLNDNHLALAGGEVLQSSDYAPIAPQPIDSRDLPNSKHIFDLVSVEGVVLMEVRKLTQDEYFLVSNGQVFSAVYYHRSVDGSPPAPMHRMPLGSTIRVTGICFPLQNRITYNHDLPSDILLRTPADITVVASPSWLSIRNLILVAGLLSVLVVFVVARGWSVERRARRQTAAMAARIKVEACLERRRSRILEDINGSKPLADILEQIVEMVSLMLNGAPCWCQVADGVRVGNCPSNPRALRLIREEIMSRSGRALGRIFAALDPSIRPCANEAKSLSIAVGLATIAIETRGLYSDLLHRSEFDPLTDSFNRFALEKRLDTCIANADPQTSIFGLIYIDLNKFKQVNDLYGHHIGDLYLQAVAARMKRQLRSMDLLARIGGDEFAVLIPSIHSRADLKEIALRLERCFDHPFPADKYVLHGSASVGIAVYPEDSLTKVGLLNSADAAMYKAKKGTQQIPDQLRLAAPMLSTKG